MARNHASFSLPLVGRRARVALERGSPSLAFGSPGMTPRLKRTVSFPAGAKRRGRESTRMPPNDAPSSKSEQTTLLIV